MIMKLIVVIHIFYIEQWNELKDYLKFISFDYDLYITLVEKSSLLRSDILSFKKNAKIFLVDNKGFDIWPFFYILNKININDYDYILKIHTKTSRRKYCIVFGENLSSDLWKKELLSFVKKIDKAISILSKDKSIGCISGLKVITTKKEDTDFYIKHLAEKESIEIGLNETNDYCFVAGTMFLVRANIFRKLQYRYNADNFEESKIGTGITFAHVLERILGKIVYAEGYTISDVDLLYPYYKKWRYIKRIFRLFYHKRVLKERILKVKLLGFTIYKRSIE